MTLDEAKNTIDSITVIEPEHFDHHLKEVLHKLVNTCKAQQDEIEHLRTKINSLDDRTFMSQRIG